MASKTWNMAIITPNVHSSKFSYVFTENLLKALIDDIDAIEDKRTPLFDEFELSSSQQYFRVKCVDDYSKQWLIDAVKKLSPFEKKSLLAVEEKTVPEWQWQIFYIYLPFTSGKNAVNLLKRIKKSTPSLKTEFWQIRELLRNDSNEIIAEIDIDTSSISLIRELKYSVRLGMGRAYFWNRGNNEGHPKAKFLSDSSNIFPGLGDMIQWLSGSR